MTGENKKLKLPLLLLISSFFILKFFGNTRSIMLKENTTGVYPHVVISLGVLGQLFTDRLMICLYYHLLLQEVKVVERETETDSVHRDTFSYLVECCVD